LFSIFFWLGYSNSTLNPVLYAIFNVDFRRAFQFILGCGRPGVEGTTGYTPRRRTSTLAAIF